jgi:hypothetical protein
MKNWLLIYTTQDLSQANIIKGMLEQNSVQVQLINKRDSSYNNFGYIELYVPVRLKDIAKHLVDQGLMN